MKQVIKRYKIPGVVLGACMAVVLSLGVPQLVAGSSASAASNGANASSQLEAGVAPGIPATRVREIALTEAASAGDATPAELLVASGSLGAVREAVAPEAAGLTASTSGTPAEESLLATQVDAVSLTGTFTLSDARLPRGASEPSGSALVLILDAQTGELIGRRLSSEVPTRLASQSANEMTAAP